MKYFECQLLNPAFNIHAAEFFQARAMWCEECFVYLFRFLSEDAARTQMLPLSNNLKKT
jgi:hypothetical protein